MFIWLRNNNNNNKRTLKEMTLIFFVLVPIIRPKYFNVKFFIPCTGIQKLLAITFLVGIYP